MESKEEFLNSTWKDEPLKQSKYGSKIKTLDEYGNPKTVKGKPYCDALSIKFTGKRK